MYTENSVQCSVHCTVYTVHGTLYSVDSRQQTVDYKLDLEVHSQNIQLDHHLAAKFFIVASEDGQSHNTLFKIDCLYLMSHLASRFFNILGTGFSSATDIDLLERCKVQEQGSWSRGAG